MSEIIRDTYEVIQQIGAGGGGIVYLAKHLRLDKQVVLKADKRKITTRPELLRREVDVLKNLNHPYIPQVYDFFTEGETVYTAMDFIDGESLDKALKRGERFPQPQVIQWGRQLLQALVYLHSPIHGSPPRGYVHSDIKPANLMRRANGDICLIDFNISLALGEENVIGASAGYASPEHYGLDFSFSSGTVTQKEGTVPLDKTRETERLTATQSLFRKKIVPDIRSDVYSTGATLYHLLSGRRPAKNAPEVVPLSPQEVSPQLVRIISKAMEPNADLRYQTAEEMLWELDHLRENDPRSIRQRKQTAVTAAVLAVMLLAGGSMTFAGLRQMQQAEQAARIEAQLAEDAERTAKQALAAVTGSEEACRRGDMPTAVRLALEALAVDSPYQPQAQKALTDALGVYDLSDSFQGFRTLELPSELLKLSVSPDGTRLAAVSAFQADIFDLETGEALAQLALEPSALSDVLFLDASRLLCAGEGAVTVYDLAGNRTLWTGKPATSLALSADGRRAAAVYKDEGQAQIYDTSTGELLQTVSFQGRGQRVLANDSFADPEDNLLALDRTGRYLAVSFSDGSLTVYDLERGEDIELLEPAGQAHFEGGFCGAYFAFSVWDGSTSIFAVVDMDALVQTEGFTAQTPFHLQADEAGICVSNDNLLVRLDPETGEQTELAYLDRDITCFRVGDGYALTAAADQVCTLFDRSAQKLETIVCDDSCDFLALSGGFAAVGSRNTNSVRVLKRESHPEAELFSYDPSYVHSEARLSQDGSTIMLFSSTGFRLYGKAGTLLAEQQLPDSGQIYDQQYRREPDGSSYLEIIYYDGTHRTYSAADGHVLEEWRSDSPDASLYEEFFTDRLRITSPLHGAPEAYDRESGALLAVLEEDAYLTYVTQAGDWVVTEYVSAQGERYGLLLNEACQVLARLPNLCDILDDTLIFDYPSGTLRQCRIYSLQELMALAE